jgi:hypothetical protein
MCSDEALEQGVASGIGVGLHVVVTIAATGFLAASEALCDTGEGIWGQMSRWIWP